jgi:hypothetical protein
MLLALAGELKDATQVAQQAGLGLVQTGVLGCVLVLSLGLNVLCVWKLIQVQDKRVSDKEQDTQRMASLNSAATTAITSLTSAFTDLERSDQNQVQVLQGVKNSLDTVILQAVTRRSYTPHQVPVQHSPPGAYAVHPERPKR